MSNVFFTSDTHFGHSNVIRYSNRPFANAQEMDEALIKNWNERVKPSDTLYHLGDFAFHREDKIREILSRLNGQKHFIKGNHDKELLRLLKADHYNWFQSVQDYKKIKVGDQTIILLHYSMVVWDKSHYGSWQLFGHSHNSLPKDPNKLSMDVGVDAVGDWGVTPYSPISFEEVQEVMKTKNFKPIDHHKPRQR